MTQMVLCKFVFINNEKNVSKCYHVNPFKSTYQAIFMNLEVPGAILVLG